MRNERAFLENKTFAEEISLTVRLKRINAQENKTLGKKKIIYIKFPCLEPKISAQGRKHLRHRKSIWPLAEFIHKNKYSSVKELGVTYI